MLCCFATGAARLSAHSTDLFVADACLRSGKWYFEVNFNDNVDASLPFVSVGWISTRAAPQTAGTTQLGADGSAQTYGFCPNNAMFYHAGGVRCVRLCVYV